MEHDIGCKIKAARIEKKLTQEQVAELLGVSRQTISNWENEKSYPDIISVIKMSECYDVSLDYLLKGEQKMKRILMVSVSDDHGQSVNAFPQINISAGEYNPADSCCIVKHDGSPGRSCQAGLPKYR